MLERFIVSASCASGLNSAVFGLFGSMLECDVVKELRMHKNFLEKILTLRKKLVSRFPQLSQSEFSEIMSQIGHYHYNKKKYLILGKQKDVYNFLIENGYNPYTVYKWLLLERLPEDIRFQIKQGEISQKKALSEGFTRRHETFESLCQNVRGQGLALIKRM